METEIALNVVYRLLHSLLNIRKRYYVNKTISCRQLSRLEVNKVLRPFLEVVRMQPESAFTVCSQHWSGPLPFAWAISILTVDIDSLLQQP